LSNFKEISKIIATLYSKQRDSDFPGANFYPHDATKEELLEANKKNPLILNEFSIVKRDEKGKLYAVMYYDEYKDEINKICRYLKDSADLFYKNDRKDYAKYLNQLAKDFKSKDGFNKSSLLWLKIDDSTGIDIKVGPIEAYLDKLFAVKRAYQSNLRIENPDKGSELNELIDIITALQPSLPFDGEDKVKLNVRMDYVIAMAGWHAELIPRGSNYPTDPMVIKNEKVAKVLIYSNNIEKRDGMLFDEVLPTLFEKEALKDLDRGEFMKNWLRFIVHHELTEELAKYKYKSYEKRLGSYSEVIRELYSTLTGIRAASVQVLKGVLSVKDYKYFLIALLLVSFRDWVISENGNSGLKAYSDGYVWCINYLLKEKGIVLDSKEGKISIDFTKIYAGIDSLVLLLNEFMLNGTEDLVSAEISKYTDLTIFKKFQKDLELIIKNS